MTRTLTISAAVIAIAMGSSYSAGIRWNDTPSMAMGLWTVQPLYRPVTRGAAVTLCLEPEAAALGRTRGYLTGGACPGNTELLIKTVVAVAGDDLEIRDAGIAVNGAILPQTRPLPRDDVGRTMKAVPEGHYRVGHSEVWVIGTGDARSYDSRYFGPIPIANLRGQASPLLVKEISAE